MNAAVFKELHTHELQTNLRSLLDNVKLAYTLAREEASRELIKRGNEFLWRLNGPVTKLNTWFRNHCAELKEMENKRREEEFHRLELERIEGEGGPASPEPTDEVAEDPYVAASA